MRTIEREMVRMAHPMISLPPPQGLMGRYRGLFIAY
jgi:hypothetical protein